MKVYLAKSNRANPETVMALRAHLLKQKIQVVEYSGGQYSHDELIKTDLLLIVPEKIIAVDRINKVYETVIGKGLAGQIQAFKHNKKNGKVYFIIEKVPECYSAVSFELLSGYYFGSYVNFNVIDPLDYVNYVTASVVNPIRLEEILSINKVSKIVTSGVSKKTVSTNLSIEQINSSVLPTKIKEELVLKVKNEPQNMHLLIKL